MQSVSARRAAIDAAKARVLKGLVVRKTADLDVVTARGREILNVMQKHARADVLQIEECFFAKFVDIAAVERAVEGLSAERAPEPEQ